MSGASRSAAAAAAAAAQKGNQTAAEKPKSSLLSSLGNKTFPKKELIKFCRGMASMLRAQLNTADALRYYGHDHPNPEVRKTLEQVRETIEEGAPAYLAFQKTGKFDEKIVGLIRAGTDSGQLHEAFRQIAHRLKQEAVFKAKVRKAVLIPILVMWALVGLFIVSQVKIIPQIRDLIEGFGGTPDTFTALLFTISAFTQKVWPGVILLMISFTVAVWLLRPFRTLIMNVIMSKWRLVRNLVMGLRQMLFLGTLNMLHANGITLAKSIETAAKSVAGTPLEDELIEAGKKYEITGLPFSEAIRKFTSCDPQVAHMISIGEKSSSLVEQLDLLTEMYEEDVEALVGDFTQIVSFLSLLCAGTLISIVFTGAFLPIFLMGPRLMSGATGGG